MKRIITLISVLILLVPWICSYAAPESADTAGITLKDNTSTVREIPVISMTLNNIPLYNALEQLLNAAGIEKNRIVLAEPLRHPPFSNIRLDLKLEKVKLDVALNQIFDKYNLYASYGTPERYICIIPYADILSFKKVSIDIKDVPINNAIETIFKDSGCKFTIGPGVTGKISLKLDDADFSSAVIALAKAGNIVAAGEKDMCGFYMKPKTIDVVTEVLKGNSSSRSAIKRINVDMNDIPLREAIDKLFKDLNIQYSIAPELNQPPYDKIKVSMKLADVPVINAISALIKSHQLSIKWEINDTYSIAPADMTQFDPTGEQSLGILERKIQSPQNSNTASGFGTNGGSGIGPGSPGGPGGFGSGSSFGGMMGGGPGSMIGGGFGGNMGGSVFGGSGMVGGNRGGGMGGMPVMPGMMPGNEAFVEPMPETLQDMVTISIPQMPVKDAVEKIEPGWTFNGDLGNTMMPGARFYNLQKDMAVGVILQAAGLQIPVNGGKVVSAKSKNDLNMIYTWKPQASRNDYDPIANATFGGGSFGMPVIGTTSNAISISAYKSNNSWLYVVLAGRASDTVLLRRLMDISGKNHVIGNIQSRPYETVQTIYNAKGEASSVRSIQFGRPSTISVQLYDVSLDEALDSIIPLVGLTYKKKGTPNNPVYSIEVKPLDNSIKPGVVSTGTSKTPAGTTTKKK